MLALPPPSCCPRYDAATYKSPRIYRLDLYVVHPIKLESKVTENTFRLMKKSAKALGMLMCGNYAILWEVGANF
ncbi:hypothetical protein V6N13_055070 [Hibiscus sabdariffa]